MSTTQVAAAPRGRYDGVLEIISYNRGLYAWTAAGAAAGLGIAARLPRMPALAVVIGIVIAVA